MQWDTLLSSERLGEPIEIPYEKKYDMSEFESDYWRIIDCSAFRRLQDKTQVFPLDKSDFVRTRLTHSLEVASLAKQLFTMIYRKIEQSPQLIKAYPFSLKKVQDKAQDEDSVQDAVRAAADIVSCAGLLHDIGNPPFGHFGEYVVGAWFKKNINRLSYRDNDRNKISLHSKNLIADLKNFEGNAQALRLVTKLHHVDSDCGLNLTAAVLNTLVKYPTDSQNIVPEGANICLHKLGYYEADKKSFEAVAMSTGTYFDNKHHRHPLTFILEAADDIAYATADLEDSYKKKLFTLDEFIGFYLKKLKEISDRQQLYYSIEVIAKLDPEVINKIDPEVIDKLSSKRKYELDPEKFDHGYRGPEDERTASSELQAMQKWINYTRHWLLYCAAYGFVRDYTDIMEGNFQSEIISNTFHEKTMGILKDAMKKFTYCSPGVLRLELSAEKIIGGLLDRFVPAAVIWGINLSENQKYRKTSAEKLMSLVSENHKKAYFDNKKPDDPEYNLYLRVLLIADFVSGMTDTYAKTLYQELNGI